jgi:hypothetical protein
VPVIVTVYVPVSSGLDHDTILIAGSNVMNDVLCELSAATVAEYVRSDARQKFVPVNVNYVTVTELSLLN